MRNLDSPPRIGLMSFEREQCLALFAFRFNNAAKAASFCTHNWQVYMSTDKYFKALIPYSLDKSLWNSPFRTFKHLKIDLTGN